MVRMRSPVQSRWWAPEKVIILLKELEPKQEYMSKLVDAALKAKDDPTAARTLQKIVEQNPNDLEAQRKLARFVK